MQTSLNDIVSMKLKMTRFADIKSRDLEWLWEDKVPLGMFTLIIGDGGIGKSTIAIDMAGHITTGKPWPTHPSVPCRVGSVMLICGEEAREISLGPKIEAAGVDVHKMFIIDDTEVVRRDWKTGKMYFDLKTGMPVMDQMIEELPDLRLVIIDPITSYMGNIDSHDNAQVRGVLDKLSIWAGENNVAVIGISHLNKNTSVKAAYRLLGSVGFGTVARHVLHVERDPNEPDDKNRRVMVQGKSNILPMDTPGIALNMKKMLVGEDDKTTIGEEWLDEVDQNAEELLAQIVDGLASTKNKAMDWLKDLLSGGPLLATDIYSAAEEDGFSEKTLKRAKKQLHVHSKKKGVDGGWEWSL